MPYRIFSLSRPGEKYARRGFRCQDSSGTCTKNGIQIVAVADGHGADDCFRSEIGASLAIDKVFCEALPLLYDESLPFSEQGIRNFKYRLWQSWREAVRRDWDSRRELGDKEPRYEFVSEKYKQRYQEEGEKYLYTAYGTTLIAAIAIENELLLLQIGDGSAAVLCANGLFTLPIPQDAENYLNVTTSLSEEDADQKIRHAVLPLDKASCTCRWQFSCPAMGWMTVSRFIGMKNISSSSTKSSLRLHSARARKRSAQSWPTMHWLRCQTKAATMTFPWG